MIKEREGERKRKKEGKELPTEASKRCSNVSVSERIKK